jgi:hypothetical protein
MALPGRDKTFAFESCRDMLDKLGRGSRWVRFGRRQRRRAVGHRREVECVDGSELARTIFTSQRWSVQPCVRPFRSEMEAMESVGEAGGRALA